MSRLGPQSDGCLNPGSHGRLRRFGAWILRERVRYAAAWFVAGGTIVGLLIFCFLVYRDGRRSDGTVAHTFIDFGGQWYMGRMVVLGQGRDLYHRRAIRPVIESAYPRDAEVPWDQLTEQEQKGFQHDADSLMSALVGEDDPDALAGLAAPFAASNPLQASLIAVYESTTWQPATQPAWDTGRLTVAVKDRGGALYPPVHALFYAPLGLLPPLIGLRCLQLVLLLLNVATAWGICLMTQRRIWWPVAIVCVMLFPGFPAALGLGQNPALSLAIVVWGWVLVQRGRPALGGIVWGLLAFKPTWGLAFFLVPVLTARWRMALAMIASGLTIALATLPIVGFDAWRDWLAVGHEGSLWYAADTNWIHIGRDVLNIPRRWLDFEHTTPEQRWNNRPALVVGWCLLGSILAFSAWVAWRRQRSLQPTTGTPAAFVFLAAWLSCYHFIYYDTLLVAPALFLLLADVRPYFTPRLLALVSLWRDRSPPDPRAPEVFKAPALVKPTLTVCGRYAVWTLNSAELTLVLAFLVSALNLPLEWLPYDTFAIILLWLWCGVQLMRQGEPEPHAVGEERTAPSSPAEAPQLVELGADVGRTHEGFADKDGLHARSF